MATRRTVRPQWVFWEKATVPQKFQFVAWRITVYLGEAAGTLVVGGTLFTGGQAVVMGGAYDAQGEPIPCLFQGTYRSSSPCTVVLEHLDPDTR